MTRVIDETYEEYLERTLIATTRRLQVYVDLTQEYFAVLGMKPLDQRQWFISHHLKIHGYVGRINLVRHFGVSKMTGSLDLRIWQENNPGVIKYDKVQKKYVPTSTEESEK